MSNIRDDEVERLAAAFAALSNPQRLRMFIRLASSCCAPEAASERAEGCCRAGEVGAGLELAASTASHHLKELRRAGLMHVERHGRRIDCWASEETLQRLASFLSAWARRQPPAARKPAAVHGVSRKGGGR
jgi:DNA-binding transcriptional ArsR family regulator